MGPRLSIPDMIGNLTVMDANSLESNWELIGGGGGGGGQVFKARHKKRGKDVAVKIVGPDAGLFGNMHLVKEAELMLRADSPYILKVLGVFRGCTPFCPRIISVGVVMDLMERGSLLSLQVKRERQPLPWPLVFRLVHQVAEGMKYLHSLTPALIHKDLKPDNILLDKDLNVKDGVVIRKYPKRDFQRLTLDTNTTHPFLSLSENNRKVTRRHGQDHSYPDHHDRFDGWYQVLCSESLTGRCYWDIEWSGLVEIAVTYRGISRKGYGGDCCLGGNDKSWRLDCGHGGYGYRVTHNNKETDLHVSPSSVSNRVDEEGRPLYRVAVYLDHPAGTLSFYELSSDTLTHLYTFQTTFTEPLYAGFRVWSGSARV